MAAYSGRARLEVPMMTEGPGRCTLSMAWTTVLADFVVEPFRDTPAKSRHRYFAQSTTSGERSS